MMARLVFFAALLLLPAIAPAEELGRLFLTPAHRAALERQRQLGLQETGRGVEGGTLSVSGVIRRGNRRVTTWVNGVLQEENDPVAGVRVRNDHADSARTTVSVDGEAPVSLKVGETVNRDTGETDSGINDGRIIIKREVSR